MQPLVTARASAAAVDLDGQAPARGEKRASRRGADGRGSDAEVVDGLARRHRLDTLITTASGLAVYALSLLTSPLLARALGADGRGSLAAVLRPTELVGWLLMFGVPAATAYHARDAARRELQATSWALTFAAGIPLVVVMWPFVPTFLRNHPPETVAWFRWSLVAALLVLPFQNTYEYLRGQGANRRFNFYRSLPIVVSTLLIVALYADGSLTLRRALAANVGANLAVPLWVMFCERALIVRMWRYLRLDLARKQLHYGSRVWLGTLSNLVLARFDQLLMVGLVSPPQLGLYAVAATGAMVTLPIAQGVGYALFPVLRAEPDDALRRERIGQALRWVTVSSVGLCAVLGLIAPIVLPAVMGEEFRAAVTAFLLLLPGQICWNVGQVYKVQLEADDRPGVASVALAVGAAITLATVPFAVRWYGIEGAAAVTSFTQLLFLVLCWRAARRP